MVEYQKYVNALRKCAKEHDNDRTSTGHIIVSDLCRDTANLLEELEQEPCEDCISRADAIKGLGECPMNWTDSDAEIIAVRDWKDTVEMLKSLPSVIPQPKTEVLDKIRVEVKALPNANPSYSGYIDVVDREDVLEIIDKYKAESEE